MCGTKSSSQQPLPLSSALRKLYAFETITLSDDGMVWYDVEWYKCVSVDALTKEEHDYVNTKSEGSWLNPTEQ